MLRSKFEGMSSIPDNIPKMDMKYGVQSVEEKGMFAIISNETYCLHKHKLTGNDPGKQMGPRDSESMLWGRLFNWLPWLRPGCLGRKK